MTKHSHKFFVFYMSLIIFFVCLQIVPLFRSNIKIIDQDSALEKPERIQTSFIEGGNRNNSLVQQSSQSAAAETWEDTAIVITSSWIKTHPTLYFIDSVMESLKLLEGLSPTAPIYIVVDGLRKISQLDHKETEERLLQLDQYVDMLYHKYNQKNIHIVVSPSHKHISGNVQRVLALIDHHYPRVEFLYYLQHDFSFRPGINHTALVKTVKETSDHQIDLVRFSYQSVLRYNVIDPCESTAVIESNGLRLKKTRRYSDNNHFARFDYYKAIMDSLGGTPRPPEGPLQHLHMPGFINCSDITMWLYTTAKGQIVTLNHLDGRKSDNSSLQLEEYNR